MLTSGNPTFCDDKRKVYYLGRGRQRPGEGLRKAAGIDEDFHGRTRKFHGDK
jgi:hypothetical protein